MKKILSILIITVVFVLMLTLAACGGKSKNEMKDEMSTLKNEGSSMMDDLSSAVSSIDGDMTQGGNITKDNSSTGLFETMTTESTTSVTESNRETATDKSENLLQ